MDVIPLVFYCCNLKRKKKMFISGQMAPVVTQPLCRSSIPTENVSYWNQSIPKPNDHLIPHGLHFTDKLYKHE